MSFPAFFLVLFAVLLSCWLENILPWPNTCSFMRFPEHLRKMSILSCWAKFSTLVRQTSLVSVRGNLFCVLSIAETETVKWLASPAVTVGLASQTGSLCVSLHFSLCPGGRLSPSWHKASPLSCYLSGYFLTSTEMKLGFFLTFFIMADWDLTSHRFYSILIIRIFLPCKNFGWQGRYFYFSRYHKMRTNLK